MLTYADVCAGIFTRCIPTAPTYGTCTFGGGGGANDSYMLIEGAVWILTFAVGDLVSRTAEAGMRPASFY
jgi:hypothetical protein